MQIGKALAGLLAAGSILTASGLVKADKPADDFLNPQDPGPRLSLMALIGPGFRAVYDHRYELEKDVTELRTQVIGDVVVPYSEIGAHVDLRMFLFSIGGSIGYHNEWHVLQFTPENDEATAGPYWGRDLAGQQRQFAQVPQIGQPSFGPPFGFTDLDREARRVKDQAADIKTDRWPFYEGRVQFLWPAQNFMGVSTAAIRVEDRPDVSYDWANGTVYSGGWHLRWETYAFFRHPSLGFLGPAVRVMNVPRHRLQANLTTLVQGQAIQTASAGSACQPAEGLPCEEVRETDIHYGFIGGLRPNWAGASDVFLTRVYTTFGLDDELFGLHLLGLPVTLLFAYQVDLAL